MKTINLILISFLFLTSSINRLANQAKENSKDLIQLKVAAYKLT